MSAPWPANSIVTNADGTISVQWGNCDLTDEILENFATTRLDELLEGLPRKNIRECVVDIAGNALSGPNALAALLRRLRKAPIHITVLRLHNNRLVDTTTAVLAEHLHEAAEQRRPLMQLHLSGNAFTALGARVLIEAAHRCNGYPRDPNPAELKSLGYHDAARRALWLRLEHQRPPIEAPASVLWQCEENGFPVCFVNKGEQPPPDAIVQMHFSFTQGPDFQDAKGKGKDKGKGKGKEVKGKGKGKDKGKGKEWQWQGYDTYGHYAYGGYAYGGKGGKSSEVPRWTPVVASEGDSQDAKGKGKDKGKDKGKGKSKGKGKDKGIDTIDTNGASPEQEAMAWLQAHRQQPGDEAARFEKAWKAWCKAQDVNDMPKAQRIKMVCSFREFWEAAHDSLDLQPGLGGSSGGGHEKTTKARVANGARKPVAVHEDDSEEEEDDDEEYDARHRVGGTAPPPGGGRPSGSSSAWLGGQGGRQGETNEEAMLRLLGRAPRPAVTV